MVIFFEVRLLLNSLTFDLVLTVKSSMATEHKIMISLLRKREEELSSKKYFFVFCVGIRKSNTGSINLNTFSQLATTTFPVKI